MAAATRRRVALAALVALGALGAAAQAQPASAAAGFDHHLHARDVDVANQPALACARCHTLGRTGALVGRPDHAACFGPCHGPAPAPVARGAVPGLAAAQRRLCTTCHAETALTAPRGRGPLAVGFPPYVATDFALTLGHQRHAAIACEACHPRTPPARGSARAAHARCAGCHDGAAGRGPVMTACAGCHQPGAGQPLPPRLVVPRDTVRATFSHPAHAARGGAGERCVTCHAALLQIDDSALPRPTPATCATAGCHDGARAFPLTSRCSTCHAQVPDAFEVARPTARFAHRRAAHAEGACGDCHPVRGDEVEVAGHAACARCHADDFHARQPVICGACHGATEPWRHLRADRPLPARTEFGAVLDHARHPGACARCHALTTPLAQLRPPRGHRACTGAGCHGATTQPAPALAACAGCHQPGLRERRVAQRAAAPWSVRAAFQHDRHARGPTGAALACQACHVDLTGRTLTDLPTPPKATCAPCHDGRAAFKLTGTACARCHPGAAR